MSIREILLDDCISWYENHYITAEYKSVYHDTSYLLAEQEAEVYKTYLYVLETSNNFVIFPSVKKKINDISELGNCKECYDLFTPHEYSGVIAGHYDESLLQLFYRELSKFCIENNIVFSFIRFNPYRREHLFVDDYEVILSNEQTTVDLTKNYESFFSSSCKRNIRKAHRDGFIGIESEKNINEVLTFEKMYVDAMKRLNAKCFFYFNHQYFLSLFNTNVSKLYFAKNKENEIFAAAVFLADEYNRLMYYHLGCRIGDANHRGITELLFYSVFKKAEKEGFDRIHLGGGASESLRDFKKKFSDETVEYYIGSGVFNKDIYNNLCSTVFQNNKDKANLDLNYLPAYRAVEDNR